MFRFAYKRKTFHIIVKAAADVRCGKQLVSYVFLPEVARDSLRVKASNGLRQQHRCHNSHEPALVDNSYYQLSTFCVYVVLLV